MLSSQVNLPAVLGKRNGRLMRKLPISTLTQADGCAPTGGLNKMGGSKPPPCSLLSLHKAMTLQAMTLHRVILVGMGLHKAKPPVHPVLGTLGANPHKSLSKATIEIGNLGGGIGQLATEQKLSTSGSLTKAGKAGRAGLAGHSQQPPQSLNKAHGHSLPHQQSLGKASQGHLQGQGMRHPSGPVGGT